MSVSAVSNRIEGIYAAYLAGSVGNGFGLLMFKNGLISGADATGIQFDGRYVENSLNSLSITLNIKTPPNTALIQGGITGPDGEVYQIQFQLPKDFAEGEFTRLETPRGPVNARLKKLRSLDD